MLQGTSGVLYFASWEQRGESAQFPQEVAPRRRTSACEVPGPFQFEESEAAFYSGRTETDVWKRSRSHPVADWFSTGTTPLPHVTSFQKKTCSLSSQSRKMETCY